MKVFHIGALIAVAANLQNVQARTFFAPKASSVIERIPRGGALESTAVAKTALAFVGAHSAVDLASPSKFLEFYQLDIDYADDPKKPFLVLEIGGAALSYVLIPALQLFAGVSFEKAVGWSCLPYIGMLLYKLVTGMHAAVGTSASSVYLNLFLDCLTCYLALASSSFAPIFIKAYGVVSVVMALLFLFSPQDACDFYKFPKPTNDDSLLTLLRMQGTVLATHGVACLVQSFLPDKTAIDTVGYGAATLGITSLWVLKDFSAMKREKPWEVYFGYVVCCIALAAYLLV